MATPMLQQYIDLKKKYNDSILLFRLGDFYEGFNEDASILSKILGITLTGRGEKENRVPMAGIPYHALKNYLPKLINNGYKVAIAEQLEEAKPGQLVDRNVTKVITAGTILDENEIDVSNNNYLVSIYNEKVKGLNIWGLSYADITTGEFKVCEFLNKDNIPPKELIIELFRLNPKEIIIPSNIYDEFINLFPSYNFVKIDIRNYFVNNLLNDLLKYFNIQTFKSYGLEKLHTGLISSAKLIEYIKDNRKALTPKFNNLSYYSPNEYMYLDEYTVKNLELFNDESNNPSLYRILNKCNTGMGQRLLRQWILRPLINVEKINLRLNIVKYLYNNNELNNDLINILNNIPDLERIITKISGKSANARDLVFLSIGLKNSLEVINKIESILEFKYLLSINSTSLEKINYITNLVTKSIIDNPPITITEGGIFRDGLDSKLDELRKISNFGSNFIKEYELEEIKKTGISSLKIRYNQVFGYYIEISKSNLSKVPSEYIRKQTLVNAERFITPKLKEWEEKILTSKELINQKEYELFEDIRSKINNVYDDIKVLSEIIANIDCLTNFAFIALKNNYSYPNIKSILEYNCKINDSRHAVVEKTMDNAFIPNDISFIKDNQELIILTGPNMSGKSTYIRQVALIYIMAQIGSFIPATTSELSIVDRIFTRVGASDNLSKGESTFMVEMLETANILNNATCNSLIILDEIGRGTSTYDGLSIAWAISEYIAKKVKAKTLFATHYHDLLLLEQLFPNIKNYNIEVFENGSEVTFMHKIIKGGLDKSYGIYVAKLAGIPIEIINRAIKVQEQLQKKSIKSYIEKNKLLNNAQIDIFKKNENNEIKDNKVNKYKKTILKIKNIDINKLTPIESLNVIKDIQDSINNAD